MVQSVDRQLAPAVAATLAELDLGDVDQAAARLAESYARALDQAAAIEAQADRVLKLVDSKMDHDALTYTDILDQVNALRSKLSARSALENLGPKLAALLVELGATPKARAAMAKGQPPAKAPSRAGSALARLQAAHGA